MSKVPLTCALVVNLLVVYCAAASMKKPTPTTNDGPRAELERMMARQNILEIIGELLTNPKSQNTAMLIDNYGGIQQVAADMLTILLEQHLLTTNKPREFSYVTEPYIKPKGETIFEPEDEDDFIMYRQENIGNKNNRIM